MSDEIKLTPAERELETALRTVRPAPAHIDLAAAAQSARGRQAVATRRMPRRLAVAAALAAIVAGAWIAQQAYHHMHNHFADHHRPPVEHELVIAATDGGPTVLAYRQAIAQTPEALDALLEQQSRAGHSSVESLAPFGASSLWKTALQPTEGTL